ncbi:MAG: ORF6N domain-containing protein [Bacteroidia bacterium]|nr:ORF6N domain-containing protein [Bacteroidia bacterium]
MDKIPAIQSKIREIRNQKVILDADLAALYGVETKRLKEAVRRNIARFPEDFMFELSEEESESLRTQFASSKKRGGSRYHSFAFTEQGVAMLSGVLNTPRAIEVNIGIMRAFVLMRQYALSHKDLTHKLKELEKQYDQQFSDVYEAINYLLAKDREEIEFRERKKIGYIKNG